MVATVIERFEQDNVSVQIVAVTEATGAQESALLRLTNVRYVRPLRIENYPSLAKVWGEDDDDDIFAS